jgi:hypothetical protein
MLFQNAGITTAGRMVTGIMQEFLLRRMTPTAKNQQE